MTRPFGQTLYSANSADLEKMAQVWATDDDVVMANPVGGVNRGWKQIQATYARIFQGTARVYVELFDYRLVETETMFYVTGRERRPGCSW